MHEEKDYILVSNWFERCLNLCGGDCSSADEMFYTKTAVELLKMSFFKTRYEKDLFLKEETINEYRNAFIAGVHGIKYSPRNLLKESKPRNINPDDAPKELVGLRSVKVMSLKQLRARRNKNGN